MRCNVRKTEAAARAGGEALETNWPVGGAAVRRIQCGDRQQSDLAKFDAASADDALHWSYDGGKAKEYQLFVNEYGAVSMGCEQKTKSPEVIAMEMLDGLLQE